MAPTRPFLAMDAVAALFQPVTSRGISVAVQIVANDLQPNFVTANQAGNGPDIIAGAHDWTGNLVQNSDIRPVVLSPEAEANYSDIALRAVTYDGQVYGTLYAVEYLGLFVNKALSSVTQPATIEESKRWSRLERRPAPSSSCHRPSMRRATPTTWSRSTPLLEAICSARTPTAPTIPRTSTSVRREGIGRGGGEDQTTRPAGSPEEVLHSRQPHLLVHRQPGSRGWGPGPDMAHQRNLRHDPAGAR